jgi:hypothetical protein
LEAAKTPKQRATEPKKSLDDQVSTLCKKLETLTRAEHALEVAKLRVQTAEREAADAVEAVQRLELEYNQVEAQVFPQPMDIGGQKIFKTDFQKAVEFVVDFFESKLGNDPKISAAPPDHGGGTEGRGRTNGPLQRPRGTHNYPGRGPMADLDGIKGPRSPPGDEQCQHATLRARALPEA